jgi:hypothetical protein
VRQTIVRAEFEQVACEQEKTLAGLANDTVLLDCGLDSPSLAIIAAWLEDQIGIDPLGKISIFR